MFPKTMRGMLIVRSFALLLAAILVASALVLISGNVSLAGETRLTPSLTLKGTYDDNLFFEDVSDFEVVAAPEFEYRYQTETSRFSIFGGTDIYRYWEFDEYDRVNQSYSFSSTFGLGDRLSFSLNGDVNIDHTFEKILQEVGEITGKSKRYRYKINPGLEYQISPRNFVRLNLRGNWVDYQKMVQDNNRDYETYGAKLLLGHDWSRKTTLYMLADYSQTHMEDLSLTVPKFPSGKVEYGQFDQEQELYQLMGGGDYSYSPNLSFSLRVGGSLARTEYTSVQPIPHPIVPSYVGSKSRDVQEDSLGLVLECGTEYEMQLMSLGLDASRSITQSADGENIARNRAQFSLTRHFSARFRGGFRASLKRS